MFCSACLIPIVEADQKRADVDSFVRTLTQQDLEKEEEQARANPNDIDPKPVRLIKENTANFMALPLEHQVRLLCSFGPVLIQGLVGLLSMDHLPAWWPASSRQPQSGYHPVQRSAFQFRQHGGHERFCCRS